MSEQKQYYIIQVSPRSQSEFDKFYSYIAPTIYKTLDSAIKAEQKMVAENYHEDYYINDPNYYSIKHDSDNCYWIEDKYGECMEDYSIIPVHF